MQPTPGSAALALRTVPVAAGVVGDLDLRTVFTAQHVTTERGAAAALNGRHHLQLTETEMTRMLAAIPIAPVTEDVADLESRSTHGRRSVGSDIEII